jgi:NosR/NirI family nitrous oxide reductase transcriptional regulator
MPRRLRQDLLGPILAVLGLLLGPFTQALAAAPRDQSTYSKEIVPGDLMSYLTRLAPGDLVPGATAYGSPEGTPPVVPALDASGAVIGSVFLNSDFASAVGYSGRPIHVVGGMTAQGRLSGTQLMDHHEPIVLIGIPETKIRAYLDGLKGWDAISLKATDDGGKPDIISGATVTVLVIQDSVIRAAAKVARRLGLGGLDSAKAAPDRTLTKEKPEVRDWDGLLGDGSVRRLSLTVADVNAAFEKGGDPKAMARPEQGAPEDTFIDLYLAQVDIPTIGLSLLGDNEYRNLTQWLKEGEAAILVMARGPYSFKGSGYVRGGLFDRIQVVQDATSVRFHDRDHHRLRAVAADNAPDFPEVGLFRIPADSGFLKTRPWRLDLLVQRATGALTKAFETFDLSYALPELYLEPLPAPEASTPAGSEGTDADMASAPLWKGIWNSHLPAIATVTLALTTLTGLFFFQTPLVRRPRLLFWVRAAFLAYTLLWLGWTMNAQLSVVNVLAFTNALATGFSWDYFLMDPLVFILWFATVAALLFWGRGPFCGWLCPFGALQEFAALAAKRLGLRQIHPPWAVNERLWPLKYVIFLGLFGLGLYDLGLAEQFAEVEPFKTAIILKFMRDWWFVLFVLVLLGAGLFVERFFCRYLCPLGGALAIPGRLRMFEWLKRWPECGTSCNRCARECPVQAIHPEGHINPHECIYCMHCQELYWDDHRCPHNVTRRLKKERRTTRSASRPDPSSEATPAEAVDPSLPK